MPDFSTKQRENLVAKGQAMPSGAFPIRNRADLKRAIQAFGRAKNPEKTKAWIIYRARQLDAMDLIPEKWLEEKRISHMSEVDDFLQHYGVPGMKWGRRSASPTASTKQAKRNVNHRKKITKAGLKGAAVAGAFVVPTMIVAKIISDRNTTLSHIPTGVLNKGKNAIDDAFWAIVKGG